MTTSLTRVMNAIKEPAISKYWLAYFRENFRGVINDQLLEAFESSGITKADIARKLGRRPEQVTRWLSAPGNLETDTISDIALAFGLVPKIGFEKVGEARSNRRVHAFIERFEQSTVSEKSEARAFIVNQSNYDTLGGRRSMSTSQPKAIVGSVPNRARVKEVSHA